MYVSVKECHSYEYEKVKRLINEILEENNFSTKLFDGAKVLLKVNLLSKNEPEKCVTTNPIIVRCLCEYIKEHNCIPIIADSPAGPYTKVALEGIYEATGMKEVSKETSAILNYDVGYKTIHLDDAHTLKSIDIINPVCEADFVISVAKLKTHGMMTFTGAVKNLFGVIPGLTKASYHMKLQTADNFSNHLLDICNYVKPAFSIIDGIQCMEGDGPSNGVKRDLGFILGGECPYALDDVACQLAKIDYKLVPTIVNARKRKLYNYEDVSWNKNDFDINSIRPFVLPKSVSVVFLPDRLPSFLTKIIMKGSKPTPKFIHDKCISCGHCVRNCPAHIIKMIDNKPEADLSNCISCFCCHEVCPADAIRIKTPWVSKLIFRGR